MPNQDDYYEDDDSLNYYSSNDEPQNNQSESNNYEQHNEPEESTRDNQSYNSEQNNNRKDSTHSNQNNHSEHQNNNENQSSQINQNDESNDSHRSTSGGSGEKKIRVQKRKRRSYQPIYRLREQRQKKIKLLIIGSASLIILMGLVLAFFYYNIVYKVESKQFAEQLSKKMSHKYGLNLEITPLKLGLKNIKIDYLKIKKIPNSNFSGSITNDLSFFFKPNLYINTDWHFNNIYSKNSEISLTTNKIANLFQNNKNVINKYYSKIIAGMGLSLEPKKIIFDAFRMDHINVNIDNHNIITDAILLMNKSDKPYVFMDNEGFNYSLLDNKVTVSEAFINVPNKPQIKLSNLLVNKKGDTLEFEDSNFEVIQTNKIEKFKKIGSNGTLSGNMKLNNLENALNLDIDFENFITDDWVNNSLKKYVSGQFPFKLNLFYNIISKKMKLNGKISKGTLSIANLTMLDQLFTLSGVSQYKKLIFEDFNADINIDNDNLKIENIDGLVPRVLKLNGYININKDETVNGEISLSFDRLMVEGPATREFGEILKLISQKPIKGNWYTVKTKLSGKLLAIEDDLYLKLQKAKQDIINNIFQEKFN